MPHLCPRPCSRLAAAAVFMSVGVVQLVVGIILLRSNFVYLLAGPDFWTSACNIAVGCLLGVAASIWKNSAKRQPSKRDIKRRNLLLALLFSALIINATTLIIFLLNEGNTLLSIRLENGKNFEQATFKSEVLAYAYVTSVCCPIICIVITIISMSGSCFKFSTVRKGSLETKSYVNAIKNERAKPLRWIYTPELHGKSKRKMRERNLSSSSESDGEKWNSSYKNCSVSSAEAVHDILSRMAQGKRDSMLTDSAAMLREMDIRRKSKYNSFDRDGSYVAPMLQKARETILGETQPNQQSARSIDLSETRVKTLQRDSDLGRDICLPSSDVILKRSKFSKSKQLGSLYKNPYTSEELVNEYQNASSKMAKHYPSQYKKFRQRFRSTSDLSEREVNEFAGVHKKPRMSEVESELREMPSEYRDENKWKSSEKVREESKSFEVTSPTYCFSPDGSDFEGDSIFEMSRRSSWAGEMVPINIKRSSGLKLSNKLVPAANPVVPLLPQSQNAPKISDDSGIGSVESNTFNEGAQSEYKNKQGFSSFQEELTPRNTDSMSECPKVGLQSVKKYDMKVVKMASISEEPTLEKSNRFEESHERYNSQDDIDLNSWQSYTGENSPYLLESSAGNDKINARRDTTIKRKVNVPGRALRKMWSLAISESKSDFRDQVVDEDSLIGLSEKELIERQLRTRSIRKVVQQRMREKLEM